MKNNVKRKKKTLHINYHQFLDAIYIYIKSECKNVKLKRERLELATQGNAILLRVVFGIDIYKNYLLFCFQIFLFFTVKVYSIFFFT